ncbi:MAG: hypothetical protein WCY98_09325 [Castellaniella sp.]
MSDPHHSNPYDQGRRWFARSLLAVLPALAIGLSACSPGHDWRQVTLADGDVQAMFPDRPKSRTRTVAFEGHALELTLSSARVGDMLYTLGYARLPPALGASTAARARLEAQLHLSLHSNLGAPPPLARIASGERFTVRGRDSQIAVRLDGMLWTTPTLLIEGLVIGADEKFSDLHADEFLRELAPAQRPLRDAGSATSG